MCVQCMAAFVLNFIQHLQKNLILNELSTIIIVYGFITYCSESYIFIHVVCVDFERVFKEETKVNFWCNWLMFLLWLLFSTLLLGLSGVNWVWKIGHETCFLPFDKLFLVSQQEALYKDLSRQGLSCVTARKPNWPNLEILT